MLKLIKLEWKKNKIKKYIIWTVLIIIYSIFDIMINGFWIKEINEVTKYSTMFNLIEIESNGDFLILMGFIISSFLVKEYKNNTIKVMYCYPINRKKLILAKLLATWIFGVCAITISKFVVYGSIIFISQFMKPVLDFGYDMTQIHFYLYVIIKAFLVATIGWIPAFIGILIKKSTKITIAATMILAFALQINGTIILHDATEYLYESWWVQIGLVIVSIIFGLILVLGVDKKDIE